MCYGNGILHNAQELQQYYLIAVIILGIILVFIMLNANKYFKQVFRKYDDLNESVQENVSAIRVVKGLCT